MHISWFFLVFFENRRRDLARRLTLYKKVIHKMRELAISYLRHYKSDFYAVKSKVGLLDGYIPFSYKASL